MTVPKDVEIASEAVRSACHSIYDETLSISDIYKTLTLLRELTGRKHDLINKLEAALIRARDGEDLRVDTDGIGTSDELIGLSCHHLLEVKAHLLDASKSLNEASNLTSHIGYNHKIE